MKQLLSYIKDSTTAPEECFSGIELKKKHFTLANFITGLGILLVVFYNYLWASGNTGIGIVSAILAVALTDVLDGYFANKNECTFLGKWLDIIRNRFFIYSVIISYAVINKAYIFVPALALALLGLEIYQEKTGVYSSSVLHRDRKVKFLLYVLLALLLALPTMDQILYFHVLWAPLIFINLRIIFYKKEG